MLRTLTVFLFFLSAANAHAYLVTIDADEYSTWTDVSDAGPGVKLSTFTNVGGQASFDPLYVVDLPDAGNPQRDFDGVVGSRVFGHAPGISTRSAFDFTGALSAFSPNSPNDYFLFRADFAQPTDFVEIRSPFHQEYADPAVLWAFDASGTFLNGCTIVIGGRSPRTGSGTQGPSTSEPAGLPCGEVLWEGDCQYVGFPYCEYVYTARIERIASDVSYVLFGGNYDSGNTPVMIDQISYRVRAVPEPGTVALLLGGLIAMGAARRRKSIEI